MASQDVSMTSTSVPAPTPVVGNTATLDPARDLRAERDAEQARDKAEAEKKRNRFTARKMTIPDRPSRSEPEFETYMFETAANNPFASLKDTAPSTFVPHLGPLFYLLMFMDHLMADTKRWIDNSAGWCPPISQMYISIMVYVQILRAMDAAGVIAPNHEFSTFLSTFVNIFPLNDLWVPGPLVAAFRNLSAFWPSSSDQFGNVTPVLPSTPGWTQANGYRLVAPGLPNNDTDLTFFLPNISVFISRMRAVCATAMTANMTQANFSNHLDGPLHIQHLFQTQVTQANHFVNTLHSPGASFAYPGNLQMWQNAGYRIGHNLIPADLDFANDAVANNWTAFFRFDNNQHVWFGNIAAIMAKYCQFFHGSVPLGEIMPNCSAAGAVKLRHAAGTTLHDAPTFHAATVAPAPVVAAHVTLRQNARLVLNGRIAVQDVPTAHVYAATTFAFNAYHSAAAQNVYRAGRFWSLGPDTDGRENIEVLPGVLTTIMRRYHSDVRIAADKQ